MDIKKHFKVFAVSGLLIFLGIISMLDFNISASSSLTDVFTSNETRVASTSLLHIYSGESNSITVYLTLTTLPVEGYVGYEFPKNSTFDSDYFSKGKKLNGITVHTTEEENSVRIYVNYDKDVFIDNLPIFKVSFPANEKKIMGKYIFQLPKLFENCRDCFPIAYHFYPPTSSNVSIGGSLAKADKSRANGFVWDDLRNIQYMTTISVDTPYLVRKSQFFLVFGALFLAAGINLLTTHIYEWLKLQSAN